MVYVDNGRGRIYASENEGGVPELEKDKFYAARDKEINRVRAIVAEDHGLAALVSQFHGAQAFSQTQKILETMTISYEVETSFGKFGTHLIETVATRPHSKDDYYGNVAYKFSVYHDFEGCHEGGTRIYTVSGDTVDNVLVSMIGEMSCQLVLMAEEIWKTNHQAKQQKSEKKTKKKE